MKKILIVLAVFFSGCMAASLPMLPDISDSLKTSLESSPLTVSYSFVSKIADGEIVPRGKQWKGHPGYIHAESSTLAKMITDYFDMKYPNSSKEVAVEPKIEISLEDFWLEQASRDSSGKQAMVVLFGGESALTVSAHIVVMITITKNGNINKKKFEVFGEDIYVRGLGTGTSTSNIYRGEDSLEFRVAEAINKSNNKFLAKLNNFLEVNLI